MSILDRLTATANQVLAWADALQQRPGTLGFPYAVIKKYGDDDGGREAALITYYGFLSILPLLLLGVAILSRVLVANTDLRQRLITAIAPPVLQSTVEHALTTLPTSPVPLIAGLIGLLFAGTGIAFSAYQTLNNVAAIPAQASSGVFLP
jgi:membrane protein